MGHGSIGRPAWSQADVNALQAGQTLTAIGSGEARVTWVWVVLRTTKPLVDLQYTYNGAGDVTQLVTTRSASTWTETFAFDGQDRLSKWTASGANAFSQQFAYTATEVLLHEGVYLSAKPVDPEEFSRLERTLFGHNVRREGRVLA